MNSKLTALIVTGSPEQISSLINNSFNNLTDLKFAIDKESLSSQPSIKYKYRRPRGNSTIATPNNSQAKIINKFLMRNLSFKYSDLLYYLETSKMNSLPSNAAISNHLARANYQRHQIILQDNSSYYSWERD
jgi:hypothetical protein